MVSRLRRNHALEHATIHVLRKQYRNIGLAGRSTLEGFILYGNIPTERVLMAAQHALRQLQAGNYELALHADCGTNRVTSGVLAGLGAFTLLTPRRRSWGEWLNRLPLVFVVCTLGVIAGQRLGTILQARITTNADVGDARIVGISRGQRGSLTVHRITVEG
jgi:hypothetical protein